MAGLTVWKDADLPVRVEVSEEAIERVRQCAVDGLFATPRMGVGVGGLFFGKRVDGGVSILEAREIVCAHTFGPPFRLTVKELADAKAMSVDDGGLQVVGMYCSKARATSVEPDDWEIFESLCPEPWQVMMLFLPNKLEASRGAFYGRDKNGVMIAGTLLPVARLKRDPNPLPPPEIAAAPGPIEVTEPVNAPAPPPEVAPPPGVAPPERPAPEPLWQSPAFATVQRRKPAGWWKWAIAGVLSAGIGFAAFLTRDEWLPRPPLDLRSSDSNGQLTIEWNRGAVRGIESGSLVVSDGPNLRTFTLNVNQLHAGAWKYARKTIHVHTVLRAGSLQETTDFKTDPPPLSAPPAAPVQAQP